MDTVMFLPDNTALLIAVARLSLGCVFLPSALSKMRDLRGFIRGTVAYQLLPRRLALWTGALLPFLELVLALLLLSAVALPLAGLASVAMLAIFNLAVSINLRRGHVIPCYCEGSRNSEMISWGIVARNGLLIVLGVVLVWQAPLAITPAEVFALWRSQLALVAYPVVVPIVSLLVVDCLVLVRLIKGMVDLIVWTRVAHAWHVR